MPEVEQWTEYQLKSASAEEVNEALSAGKLQSIMSGTAETGGWSDEGQKSEAWLATATPEEISEAHRTGALRNVLTGRTDAVIAAEKADATQREAEQKAFVMLNRITERLAAQGIEIPDDWGTE